ncbi:MAG TPA: BON domain-containing protein [Usitatibacter sp.]|jgi:lipopolysaccharide assembly outer membrane protein LptD (OstA)|nr:BON domain-containing protein [Usitatibacter sp.]
MTKRLSQAVAAALAAGAVSFTFAQSDSSSTPALQQPAVQPPATQPATQPRIPPDLARLHFAQEPVARPLKDGDDDALVRGIVTALNGDGSLQGSKITVSADKGVVTLTGATMTPDQKARVDQLAVAQAGEGNVIDTVLDSVT